MAQLNNTAPSIAAASPPLENPHTTTNDVDMDTCMSDASTNAPNSHKPNLKTALQKKKEKEPHILHQATFRHPSWTYFHLRLTSPSAPPPSTTINSTLHDTDLSPLLISPLLTSALRAYLGTTGAAIPVDILKTSGTNVWIRVPRQDARGVRAALSSWVGSVNGADVGVSGGRIGVAWRVGGQSEVLGLLVGGEGGGEGGRDVFG